MITNSNYDLYLIKVDFLACLSLSKARGSQVIEAQLTTAAKLLQLASIPPK